MRVLCFDAIRDGKPLNTFPGIALAAACIGLLAMTDMAEASSILVVGVSTSTPSIVKLEAIEPVQLSVVSTPSMVALGDPIPAVTDEKVAAIPEKPRHGRVEAPMIIRGGIVGGAFATPTATASAKPAAPAAAAPANGTAPATPANGTAAANSNGKVADNKTAATANPPSGAQPQSQPPNGQTLPRAGKAM